MVNSVLGLDPRSRRFESYHSDKLTGCNSVGRELASDARGRWFEPSRPDKYQNVAQLAERTVRGGEVGGS